MENLIQITNIVTKKVSAHLSIEQETLIHFNNILDVCEIKTNLSDPKIKKSYDVFMQVVKEFMALEHGLEEAYGKPDLE